MKKIILTVSALLLATSVFAGGVQQNTNQSAEWAMTGNRNASIAADSTFYNPAGTAFMEDGLHLYLSNQIIGQTRIAEDKGDTTKIPAPYPEMPSEFKGDLLALLFPNAYAVYKMDNMAFSLGFLPIGGGGSAQFDDGLPSFFAAPASFLTQQLVPGNTATTATGVKEVNAEVSGSSAYLGGQANFAYAINEMIAASIGGLYYYAKDTSSGSIDATFTTLGGTDIATGKQEFEFEETGSAFGIVLGTDIKPMDNMNVGIRYQWNSELEMERKFNKTPDNAGFAIAIKQFYPDEAKVVRTLPQLIGLGVAYDVSSKFSVQPNFTYYLNTAVEFKETGIVDGDGDGTPETNYSTKKVKYDNGFDAGIGFDWQCMFSEKVRMGAGYFYTKNGSSYVKYADLKSNEENGARNERANGLDSQTFNFGARVSAMKDLDITGAFYYTQYFSDEIESILAKPDQSGTVVDPGAKMDISKYNWSVALGASYRMDLGAANSMASDLNDQYGDEAMDAAEERADEEIEKRDNE